jgi:hypothetical protein
MSVFAGVPTATSREWYFVMSSRFLSSRFVTAMSNTFAQLLALNISGSI